MQFPATWRAGIPSRRCSCRWQLPMPGEGPHVDCRTTPSAVSAVHAETAAQKVRMAEDAWNTRDPERVSLAYTPDSVWRNRAEFLAGREAIVAVPDAQMGQGARLSADQGTLGLPREPHRCSLRLRMARRFGQLVPLVRQRELGVRRATGSCSAASPASMTCRSPRASASITGRWAGGPDDHPGLSALGL